MKYKEKLLARQFRPMTPLQIRNDAENNENSFFVEGYATKWKAYELFEDDEGPIFEKFSKETFKDTDMSDIIFLYDHQGKVLARISNETLKTEVDDTGLFVRVDLSKSIAARELYDEIKAGLITKMSWAFRLGEYEFDEKTRTIIHHSVKKVYDVSAVGIPANNDTEINARNFADGVIGKFKTERSEAQKHKKALALKIKIACK